MLTIVFEMIIMMLIVVIVAGRSYKLGIDDGIEKEKKQNAKQRLQQ